VRKTLAEINEQLYMKQLQSTFLKIIFLILVSCSADNSQKIVTNDTDREHVEEHRGDLPDTETKFPDVKDLEHYKSSQFVPTIESNFSSNKNAVYCVTMLYAWNAIREILSSPFQFGNVSKDFELLNSSKLYKKVLDTLDYKIKAEVDNYTVRTEASFNKSLPFDHVLSTFEKKENIVFKNKRVASFGIKGDDHEAAIALDILYYKDNNNFLIKLAFKDTLHEIILYKSEHQYASMDKIISEINNMKELGTRERKQKKKSWRYVLNETDEVVIPKFKFNIESNYRSIEGQSFITMNSPYTIKKAWQQIAFVLDEGGAGVGSNAATWMEAAMMPEDLEKPRPKLMRFDKPFFMMLKKKNSQYPYFAMWTSNTELMVID
jgi:hypothetical protein